MVAQRKVTRKKKIGDFPVVQDKFAEIRQARSVAIQPKTENQGKVKETK